MNQKRGTNTLLVALICAIAGLSTVGCGKLHSRPLPVSNTVSASSNALVDINSADAKQLATLPGIGDGLADRIVEYRQLHGPFRRVEHLMLVPGISDRRFRSIRDTVTVTLGNQ
jgi:competence ComEA-like helix-hairpin-helix protein